MRSSFCGKAGLWAVLMLVAGGCKVGPDYRAPEPDMPESFGSATAEAQRPTSQPVKIAPLDTWWTALGDPVLDRLIERAQQKNFDLREALARVREARASRTAAGADLLPIFDASAAYTRSRSSENRLSISQPEGVFRRQLARQIGTAISQGAAGSVPQQGSVLRSLIGGAGQGLTNLGNTPAVAGAALEQDLFQWGFDMNWEIDVFGGTRRAIEAAEADIEAAEYSAEAVRVSLSGEVARVYTELRGAQKRLDIAGQNIVAQRDSVTLAETRFNAGLTSELDVAQARSQLAATESQVPALQILVFQSMFRLAVLLGDDPRALVDELLVPAPIAEVPQVVPLGLPSELLRRRPDIRLAERQLAASTARIGEAVAELFPKFSITGAFGMQSVDIRDMVDWRSRAFNIGPTIRWRLFDGARIRANIRAATAREEQALAAYERTVVTALEEVETALTAYQYEQQRYRSLLEVVAASRRAVELSNELYSRGLTNFLNVLDAERSLYQAEDQLVQSEQAVVTNLIALYKALGGGWDTQPAELPTLEEDLETLLSIDPPPSGPSPGSAGA